MKTRIMTFFLLLGLAAPSWATVFVPGGGPNPAQILDIDINGVAYDATAAVVNGFEIYQEDLTFTTALDAIAAANSIAAYLNSIGAPDLYAFGENFLYEFRIPYAGVSRPRQADELWINLIHVQAATNSSWPYPIITDPDARANSPDNVATVFQPYRIVTFAPAAAQVPEPGTLLLVSLGITGLAGFRAGRGGMRFS